MISPEQWSIAAMAERLTASVGVPTAAFVAWLEREVRAESEALARIRASRAELPSQSFEVATAVDQVMERRADQCWRCDARPGEGDVGLCGDCLVQLRSAS